MTQRKTVCLDFYSTYEILDFVQVASDHLGRLAGLDDDALHWVGVAVRESVINAIKHGNCDDERKHVYVEFTPLSNSGAAGIAIRVRDDSLPRAAIRAKAAMTANISSGALLPISRRALTASCWRPPWAANATTS